MRTLTELDYTGRGVPEQRLDAYLPDGEGFDAVLCFHGGGFRIGDKGSPAELFAEAFTEAGFALVSPEYRMLPENHYPDFLYDAARAVGYTLEHLKEWGGNGRLFLSGQSAGAYLTMMLYLNEHYFRASGVDPEAVTGYLSESAQQFAHFNVMNDRGLDGRLERIDETAPIYYVHEGMRSKPLRLLFYSDDMPCRPEENRLMLASLRRFVPPEMVDAVELEGGHCRPERPEERVAAYLDFFRKTR